jgi:hypothetical protein
MSRRRTVVESTEPLIPEEEAALRALEAKHRLWWVALFLSMTDSVPATVILNTIWIGQVRDHGPLAWLTPRLLAPRFRATWPHGETGCGQ